MTLPFGRLDIRAVSLARAVACAASPNSGPVLLHKQCSLPRTDPAVLATAVARSSRSIAMEQAAEGSNVDEKHRLLRRLVCASPVVVEVVASFVGLFSS